nr:YraN family protein [uncultured Shimia sp.]
MRLNALAQPSTPSLVRRDRGKRAYLSGAAAEQSVERHYVGRGCVVAARRWRKAGAEIDLVVRDGDVVVFIEVKKSASFESAAQSLGTCQVQRIQAGAAAFLVQEPLGELTECRFDVALVNATGEIQILDNAF